MTKNFEVEFLIDGKKVGSSTLTVIDGELLTDAATDEFFAVLRKNTKSLIQEAEDEERSSIVDNLTKEQEQRLQEFHAISYHGTDDNMSDAFEAWLEDLSVGELKIILK